VYLVGCTIRILFIGVRKKEVIKTGCRMIVRLPACINRWRRRIFVYDAPEHRDIKLLQQYKLFYPLFIMNLYSVEEIWL